MQNWAQFEQIASATLDCPGSPRAGLSVAVFTLDEILYMNSFGYSDIERETPLGVDHIMAVASVTKTFTSSLMASLSAEGKLDWGEDVRTYLPELQFPSSSPFATQTVTPVDLLAHRLGVDDQPYLWINNNKSTLSAISNSLKYFSPSIPFRTLANYNNLAYTTGGYVGMKLLHSDNYDEVIRERIFSPLGMKNSYGSWKVAHKTGRFPKVYEVNATTKALGLLRPEAQDLDNMGPSGCAASTIEDMIKWVRFHMRGGKNDQGEQVIPKEQLQFLYKPREIHITSLQIEEGDAPFSLFLTSTALGWFNGIFNGRKLLWHDGALPGGNSFVTFLPSCNVGMVYLSNTFNARPDYVALMVAGLETALQGYTNIYHQTVCIFPCPWLPRCSGPSDKDDKPDVNVKEAKSYALNIQDYVGEYNHPAFGVLYVQLGVPEGLQFDYGELHCQSTSQINQIFTATCTTVHVLNPSEAFFSFKRNFDSEVDQLDLAIWGYDTVSFTNTHYQPAFWTYPRKVPTEL